MVEIKTDRNASEHPITFQQWAFDALFMMHATWHHLGSPSSMQLPQLSHNNLHPSISSEPLIQD